MPVAGKWSFQTAENPLTLTVCWVSREVQLLRTKSLQVGRAGGGGGVEEDKGEEEEEEGRKRRPIPDWGDTVHQETPPPRLAGPCSPLPSTNAHPPSL